MMGMMGDPKKKKLAALIISAASPGEEKEESGMYDEEMMKSAGEEILSGLEKKDPMMVAQAVKSIVEMCYSESEGEESEDGKES